MGKEVCVHVAGLHQHLEPEKTAKFVMYTGAAWLAVTVRRKCLAETLLGNTSMRLFPTD